MMNRRRKRTRNERDDVSPAAESANEEVLEQASNTRVIQRTPMTSQATLVVKMTWTEDMEDYLVRCWKKYVQPAGGKSKSVWKTVANAMEQNFVGCGASDNACKNRFASLKSDYTLYQQMMSETSGFGGSMRNLTEPKCGRTLLSIFLEQNI
jgi:hypothetical protein